MSFLTNGTPISSDLLSVLSIVTKASMSPDEKVKMMDEILGLAKKAADETAATEAAVKKAADETAATEAAAKKAADEIAATEAAVKKAADETAATEAAVKKAADETAAKTAKTADWPYQLPSNFCDATKVEEAINASLKDELMPRYGQPRAGAGGPPSEQFETCKTPGCKSLIDEGSQKCPMCIEHKTCRITNCVNCSKQLYIETSWEKEMKKQCAANKTEYKPPNKCMACKHSSATEQTSVPDNRVEHECDVSRCSNKVMISDTQFKQLRDTGKVVACDRCRTAPFAVCYKCGDVISTRAAALYCMWKLKAEGKSYYKPNVCSYCK